MSAAATTTCDDADGRGGQKTRKGFCVEKSARAVPLFEALHRGNHARTGGAGVDGDCGQRGAAGDRNYFRCAGGKRAAVFKWRAGSWGAASIWLSRMVPFYEPNSRHTLGIYCLLLVGFIALKGLLSFRRGGY